jgi:UDP-perosamine 4-acetyltransferase
MTGSEADMDIIIIGAGGHGKVVLDIVRLSRRDNPVGFVDADESLTGTTVAGIKVLGDINLLGRLRRQGAGGAIVAIGDNRIRRSYVEIVRQAGLSLVNAIHPSAVIAPSATLGVNVVVAAGAIINPEAQIDDSAIINTGAIVDHECRVGNAAHVCPGVVLAGRVTIGDGAFLGVGARVLPCLTVGRLAMVGAGAVVLEDVPPLATVVGVPARVIKLERE